MRTSNDFGIGHNSSDGAPVDPGPDPGPDPAWNLDPKAHRIPEGTSPRAIEAFTQAVREQGTADTRLRAIDNALARWNRVLVGSEFKLLYAISSVAKWRSRGSDPRCVLMTVAEMGLHAGIDANHAGTILKSLERQGAVACLRFLLSGTKRHAYLTPTVTADDRSSKSRSDLIARIREEHGAIQGRIRENARLRKRKQRAGVDDATSDVTTKSGVTDVTTKSGVTRDVTPDSGVMSHQILGSSILHLEINRLTDASARPDAPLGGHSVAPGEEGSGAIQCSRPSDKNPARHTKNGCDIENGGHTKIWCDTKLMTELLAAANRYEASTGVRWKFERVCEQIEKLCREHTQEAVTMLVDHVLARHRGEKSGASIKDPMTYIGDTAPRKVIELAAIAQATAEKARSRVMRDEARFHRGDALPTIGFTKLADRHGNEILDAATGATKEAVLAALDDIQDEWKSRKVSAREIVDEAVHRLRQPAAATPHATGPQRPASGPTAQAAPAGNYRDFGDRLKRAKIEPVRADDEPPF